MSELPISRQRLEELYEENGLGEEARAITERVLANAELPTELRLSQEELMEDVEDLTDADKRGLAVVSGELKKAQIRRANEIEASGEWLDRAIQAYDRAVELDRTITTKATIGEVVAILKEHGEPVPLTDEDLTQLVEIERRPEAEELVAIPESEVPTDENGIPTPSAARNGIGLPDPGDEDGKIFLDPLELEAMRVMAQSYPYREHVEERLEDAAWIKQQYLDEFHELDDDEDMPLEELMGESAAEFARRMTEKTIQEAYILTLATTVKEYPHDPRDIIHHFKGKKSKGAQRYKEHSTQKFMQEMVRQTSEEMIERGIFERVVAPDGTEYLRRGPNWEEYEREVEEQKKQDE